MKKEIKNKENLMEVYDLTPDEYGEAQTDAVRSVLFADGTYTSDIVDKLFPKLDKLTRCKITLLIALLLRNDIPSNNNEKVGTPREIIK